ncbi:hypothetical protein [Methylocystis parvus]|uniref:hypothetical protein n=1 Tax=Methylocystis parvus TaxID=134 RepID=UPI003C77F16B
MPAAADDRPNPSFPCDKAKALDEIAICSDARLAELDRLRAEDFRKALAADPKDARESAKSRLEARAACANDRVCILDMLRYSGSSPEPKWVEGYRAKLVRDVLSDDLSIRSNALVGKRGSFATSSKGVQATLSSIDGLDTSHASATAIMTPADFREYCERDPGGSTTKYGGKLSERQCAETEERSTHDKTLRSSADCKAKSVTIWDGTWRFLSFDETGITWKGPQGDVQESWAGTSAADAQFELLCPNTYARVRADAAERKAVSPRR